MYRFYRVKFVSSHKEPEGHFTMRSSDNLVRFSTSESKELIVQNTDNLEISIVMYRGDLWDGFSIGWFDLVTPCTQESEPQASTGLSLIYTEFISTHALGLSVFTSRILVTDL
jgi:hypothetical protein